MSDPEILAAYPDLEVEDVREAMRFHPVMTLGEVLDLALEPARHAVS